MAWSGIDIYFMTAINQTRNLAKNERLRQLWEFPNYKRYPHNPLTCLKLDFRILD